MTAIETIPAAKINSMDELRFAAHIAGKGASEKEILVVLLVIMKATRDTSLAHRLAYRIMRDYDLTRAGLAALELKVLVSPFFALTR